jgi:hypothetical protein
MITVTEFTTAYIATAVLTSNQSAVTAGKTVTIGTKIYTFVASLSSTEGQVLAGANAAASMANLVAAINHAAGHTTTYYCAAANADVTATATSTYVTTLTVIANGTVACSTDEATLSFGTKTVTVEPGDLVLVGKVEDVTPTVAAQQVTVGQYPAGNINWSRAVRASSTALSVVRNGADSFGVSLDAMAALAVIMDEDMTWTPPIISTDPSDSEVTAGANSSFAVVGESELTMTYVWERSTDDGENWTAITGATTPNDGQTAYTTYTTATLGITVTAVGMDGYLYRCKVTDSNSTPGTATSSSATLTVNAA